MNQLYKQRFENMQRMTSNGLIHSRKTICGGRRKAEAARAKHE
jgi:hypothetical protein